MLVLDTDHLVEMQWGTSAAATALMERLVDTTEEFATTIVSAEEQMRGWLAMIHHEPKQRRQIKGYEQLRHLFDFYAENDVLPWDDAAADEFERLRSEKIRIPTMDLKIACIALVHNAVLLSRNLRDFRKVPGLRVEDWLS
jgi:tRNA(fMet)-specific endonuclease VapC